FSSFFCELCDKEDGPVSDVFVRDVLSFEESSEFLRHKAFKDFDET
ncbi:5353_t:CDS:1, partial [Ambispora gerdemannii]